MSQRDVTSTITPLVVSTIALLQLRLIVDTPYQNSAAVVEGDTSFPYTQDADANAPASAQAAQGEAGPAQGGHFSTIPGIKDTTLPSPSQNESPRLTHSVASAKDSEEAASHSSLDSLNKSDEFLDLEKLMQERLPLDLTGEIVIMDFQRFKYGGFAFVYKGAWKVRYVSSSIYGVTSTT